MRDGDARWRGCGLGETETPDGVDAGAAGLGEALKLFGVAGCEEIGQGAEFAEIEIGFAVDGEAHAGKEVACIVEAVEFVGFDVVLFEEFCEGVVLFTEEAGVGTFQIDVAGDPGAAALAEAVADIFAEALLFGCVEIDEEAFIDDGEFAGGKAFCYGIEGGGVEGVEGLEFVVGGRGGGCGGGRAGGLRGCG